LNSFWNSGFTAARISRTSSRLFTSVLSFNYLLVRYLHGAPLLRNRAGRTAISLSSIIREMPQDYKDYFRLSVRKTVFTGTR
jgi:hypothetical protein